MPNTNFTGYLVHIPGRAFSVFTGADGTFRIDNVPAGTYTLVVEHVDLYLPVMDVIVRDSLVDLTPIEIGNCGPSCTPGQACTTALPGVCSVGLTECNADVQTCVPATAPGTLAETCDGLDNNCDGQIDEGAASCPMVANGVPACVNQTCGVGTCSTGFANCNNDSIDGCEINTRTSVNNCGACGQVCPGPGIGSGFPACVNGTCRINCSAGFIFCGDGCFPGNFCPDL